MKRTLACLASAALVVTFAAGCGGGSDGGGRPSVDEISSGIQDNMGDQLGGDVTDDMAKCLATAFHDSDLSDDALQAIVDGDENYDASDEDTAALSSLSTGAVTDCVAGGSTDAPAE